MSTFKWGQLVCYQGKQYYYVTAEQQSSNPLWSDTLLVEGASLRTSPLLEVRPPPSWSSNPIFIYNELVELRRRVAALEMKR